MARPRTQGQLSTKKPTEFGQILKDYRRNSGFSQAELASRAGVSTGYVGMIETGLRGDRPSLDIVERFVDALRLNNTQAQVLASAAGYALKFGKKSATNEELRLPPFAVFMDGDPTLSRDEKKIFVQLYKKFTEARASEED